MEACAMNGQAVILRGDVQRQLAKRLIDSAPLDSVVNIRAATRSLDQNAKMHCLLSDVARAKPQGRVMRTDDWKCVFMAACGHRVRFVPALDGDGVVPLGFRSSRLTKREMSDLIESIYAFGVEHGVQWSEPMEQAA